MVGWALREGLGSVDIDPAEGSLTYFRDGERQLGYSSDWASVILVIKKSLKINFNVLPSTAPGPGSTGYTIWIQQGEHCPLIFPDPACPNGGKKMRFTLPCFKWVNPAQDVYKWQTHVAVVECHKMQWISWLAAEILVSQTRTVFHVVS
jgi:hypothetical protein